MKAAQIKRIFAKPPRNRNPTPTRGLTSKQRVRIRAKTGGTCHVCGGPLGSDWQADHVVPHHLGGPHTEDNYLPACRTCNRLRWMYSPRVLQLVIRFGLIAKQEIRHNTQLGEQLLRRGRSAFHDNWRRRRRVA